MRSIGINLFAAKGLPAEVCAKTIASLGFTTTFTGILESAERQARIADLLVQNGIKYETIHAPFGHINDIWLDCEGGEVMLNELKTCVDRCKLVGAPIAVVHLSAGEEAPTVTDIGRARFGALVEYAYKNGIIIAFENQRKLANISWAFETFSPEDSVGFCWDCGHESCFTPGREYMPLFGHRLICTHIHDNSGEFNADQHKLPFDGQINYTRWAEHLRHAGYEGSLMLEVKSKFYGGITPEQFLERAADAVKKLRAMVDGE
ncbi:MAG: sugar phosphate isomerase/epimerase [Clostridia bacterium]|nr:sugar phosphate isomerase/epimerase [Clostridia bacterium]